MTCRRKGGFDSRSLTEAGRDGRQSSIPAEKGSQELTLGAKRCGWPGSLMRRRNPLHRALSKNKN